MHVLETLAWDTLNMPESQCHSDTFQSLDLPSMNPGIKKPPKRWIKLDSLRTKITIDHSQTARIARTRWAGRATPSGQGPLQLRDLTVGAPRGAHVEARVAQQHRAERPKHLGGHGERSSTVSAVPERFRKSREEGKFDRTNSRSTAPGDSPLGAPDPQCRHIYHTWSVWVL